MAINLGEAIANQGKFTPENVVPLFERGYRFGAGIRGAEETKRQKADQIIADSTNIKYAISSKPLAEEAKRSAEQVYSKAAEGVKKYGLGYINSPEYRSLKIGAEQKIKNLEEEDKNIAEIQKQYRSNQSYVDPEFIRLHSQGTPEEYRSYKDEAFGFGVDPESLKTNYRPTPKADFNKIINTYLSDDKYDQLYQVKPDVGGRRGFYKPSKQNLEATVNTIIEQNPDVIRDVQFRRRDDIKKLGDQMIIDARNSGQEINEIAAYDAAARKVLEQEILTLKPNVSRTVQDRATGSGNEEDTGIGDITQGSLNLNVPQRDGSTKLRQVQSPVNFTSKPVPALVANTNNIYTIDGKKEDKADVQKATYGQFAVVPVYKKGTKGNFGGEIGGKMVSADKLESEMNKGVVEYRPVAIGYYTTKILIPSTNPKQFEEVQTDIYRPLDEVSGAIQSGMTNKAARAKISKQFSTLNSEAQRLNQGMGQQAPAKRAVSLKAIKASVGKPGFEGYTEQELIDYYKSNGYTIE